MRYVWLIFIVLAVNGINCHYSEDNLYVGNPDDDAEIERPCPTYDIRCIRRFFAEHGHCRAVHGPVPDPMFRSQTTYYIPRANLTVTVNNQRLTGLNGRIEEFYVNKKTDKLVIAIEFRGLTQTSDNVYFRFHRRAKEDIVIVDFVSVIYPSVVMTAVFPKTYDLQLDKSEITAFLNDANPPTVLGPDVLNSTDPQVQVAVAAILSSLGMDGQELFLTDATYPTATYIQYNICDFGLKVE